MLNGNTLQLDLKVQDKFRAWLADRSVNNAIPNLTLKSVALGDSDIDYNMLTLYNSIKILNTPYDNTDIKYKLIYEGIQNAISGNILCFGRHINSDGGVEAFYNYPPNSSLLTVSSNPPALVNGFDLTVIPFSAFQQLREGWVLFFQTTLNNYLDANGNQLRLIEPYTMNLNSFSYNSSNIVTSTIYYVDNGIILYNDSYYGIANSSFPNISQSFPGVAGTPITIVSGNPIILNNNWRIIQDYTNGSLMVVRDNFSPSGSVNINVQITGMLSNITKNITVQYVN